MDFKSMKRKELQALCKKHGISANTTNFKMIENLSSILQETIKPKGCLKGSGGSSAEDLGILRVGSKKVTFVLEDEEEAEESTIKRVGRSMRKSTRRRSRVAHGVEKRTKEIEKESPSESPKNVTEGQRRTTRSRGLAEAVLWSPVIEKKKKQSRNETKDVRQNAEVISCKEEKGIFDVVPTTRSLRNRVVVVGGGEELVSDQNPRRTQKRKNSNENKKVAALLEEEEVMGRKNLRKRSRDGDSVEDGPPCRRSNRNHEKLEETVVIEEADVGRSKKRNKGVMGASVNEKVVDEENERVPKPGRTLKRSRGNVLNCVAMETGAVHDVAGQKKAVSQGKNHALKRGNSTDSISDIEAVTGPTRRSTRSSSALFQNGDFVSPVGKSVQEGEAVRKGKAQKQAKGHASKGGDSASLLLDGEVVAEPVRRSTRSSSTLLEDGTTLPIVGKSVKGGEATRKGKSEKQAKAYVLKGVSTTLLPDSVVVVEPIRGSTCSSSSLLENGTSLLVVGKSVKEDEAVRETKSQRQGKNRASKGGVSTASVSDNEAIAEPTRRSTHISSKLLETAAHLPAVGKLGSDDEAIRNIKPGKHKKGHGASKPGYATVFLPDNVVTEYAGRSNHSSSKLLVDATFSPVVGKLGGHGDTVRKDISGKLPRNHAAKQEDSTSLPNNESITTPKRRSTRSSSNLLEDEMLNNEAVTTPTRRSTRSSLKSWEDEMLNNEAVTTPTRRSTHSSSKMSVRAKLDDDGEAVQKNKSGKQPTPRRSRTLQNSVPSNEGEMAARDREIQVESDNNSVAQTETLEVQELREEFPRRSTQSASKGDELYISAIFLTVSDEILETKQKKLRTREAASEEDMFIMERENVEGFGSRRGGLKVSSTSSQRKSLRKVPADNEVVQRLSFPHPALNLLEDDKNGSDMRQSSVDVQFQKVENGTSLMGAPKDVDDVCFGSHIKEKQSSSLEIANEARHALSLNCIEDSSEIQENVSGQLVCSNIDVTVEAEGTLESYGNDEGKDSAPVEFTSSTMKANNGGDSVGVFDGDSMAGMDSQNITRPPVPLKSSEDMSITFHTEIPTVAHLNGPDSAVGVDVGCEDIMAAYEATHVSSPQFPCSSEELSVTSDSEASPGIDLVEPNLKAEIRDSTEDGLEGNEETDTGGPALVCKSSEELPASDTEASPVIDLEEPDSKVEVDGPSENSMAGSGASKIIDLITSDSEACPKAFHDINAEESNSKVEVHVTSKGGIEDTANTNTFGSPLSCKSTGVLSPTLLPTIFNEVSPGIDLGEPDLKVVSRDMSKAASHSADFLNEANDIPSKTLEVSMAADWDAGDLYNIQRIPDTEMTNCKADSDNILNSQLAPTESNAGKKIEAPAGDTDSQSWEAGLEVIKETWVSSTLSVTVDDGTETEGHTDDAEDNGDELRQSSPSKSPAFSLCSGDHLKEHGTQSSPKEIVDGATALRSYGSAKQSDFTRSVYDEDPADAEGNSRDSYDDKFCEDNNNRFLSPVAFVKPEGPSYVLSITYKDNESSHSKIGLVSTEITEGKSYIDHRISIQSPAARSKPVKQREKEYRLHDVDVGSKGHSDLTNDNRSLTDPVLFGGVKEVVDVGDLRTLPMSLTGGEEILPVSITETPAALGYEDSTKQVGIQDFPCVPDNEDTMHPSAQQGVTVNDTESLDVDSMDRSPKSTPEANDSVEPLNVVADILLETADTANELTDVEFKRNLKIGAALVAEETENIESLESEAGFEGHDDTVMKKADSTGRDKFYHFDEVGQKPDETFLLQEIKGFPGELHPDDIASHPSVENSASMPGEERVLSLEYFASSTNTENVPSLRKKDVILSDEEQLNKDNTKKTSAEEQTLSTEELPSCVSFIPVANWQEIQVTDSNNKEVRVNMESRLPWTVLEGPLAASGEFNEEERTQVSPIKAESILEATVIIEQRTAPPTSENTYLIPADAFKCKEAGLCKISSLGGTNSVDKHDEDNNLKAVYITALSESVLSEPRSEDADNADVELEENSDYNTIIASSKMADTEHDVDLNMSICGMAHDSELTRISENKEALPAADKSLIGLKKLIGLSSTESLTTVLPDSSSKFHTQDEVSNKNQGTIESFEQASNVEEAWVAPGAMLLFAEDLFHMDSEVVTFANDSAQVDRCGQHEENLADDNCGNILHINTTQALPFGEDEMKAVAVSGSSDVETEEGCSYEREISPIAEKLSGGSAKPCAGVVSQATNSAEQPEGQEERRIFIQQTSEVAKFIEDEMFAVLDGTQIEGSGTGEPKLEKVETTPIPTVAKQEEVTFKESSAIETRPIGNELKDSNFKGTFTAQHALVSMDTEAAQDGSTTIQKESIVSKEEIMAPEEYFKDFGWSFAETVDVSSHQEVDSQLPMESTVGNSADHSSISGIDVNEEQNKSRELDQIEDSKECAQTTPMRLVRISKSYSVIDDVIRNKENTVGLKLDSSMKQNEKSMIPNSSRRPLQCMQRNTDEH